jgi:N-methylhydantoinase B
MILHPGADREMRVGTYRARIRAGDRARNMTGGGGGYGDPARRDPVSVLEDVKEGYVSLEAARQVYKVAIADGVVDEAATRALRRSGAGREDA